MGVAEAFIKAVNSMTPDVDDIYNGAKNETAASWKTRQNAMVTGTGALSMAIPGAHIAAIAADVAFVVNRMGVSTYGVGAIRGYDAGHGNILEEEDFGAVLGYWADDEDLRQAMKGKGAAKLATKVGSKVAAKIIGKGAGKILTKTMLASAGYLVGKKLGGKGLAKAAAKFVPKVAGKGVSGFVPFLGPAVSGGVNLWLLSTIMASADEFYQDKVALISRIERGEFG